MTQSSGQIIKSHGRRYVVEASDGRRYDCTTRGKRPDYACGDRVDLLIHNDEQAVIERDAGRGGERQSAGVLLEHTADV